MKRLFQVFSIFCFVITAGVLMFIMVGYIRIPDEMTINEYDSINVGKTYVCQTLNTSGSSRAAADPTEYETSIKLFNIFPVKSAKVKVSQRKYVSLGGDAFGIRLYTRGVMVIRIDEVSTPSGNVSPGKTAGLKQGDIILSVDGVSVSRNQELSSIISQSNGNALKLNILRNGNKKVLEFKSVKSADDSTYKGGLWVRDSTAGIGTITWYDRETNIFAGLGHAVCDVDTGEIMPLSGGDAVRAEIKGCYKGTSGSAGELCGVFSSGTIGNLYVNGNTGVYGVFKNYKTSAELVPTALNQEIKTGDAEIVCTVDGEGPKHYSAKIVKIYNSSSETQRNLVIKITDKKLIEKTGGIVQGMSGSPILQNGMLVGAVTHVFVDDPTQGYGIFVQSMLETAENNNYNNLAS